MQQVEIQLIIAKMFSLYLPYFDKKWFMSAERSLKTRQHLPFFFSEQPTVLASQFMKAKLEAIDKRWQSLY